MQIEFYQQNTDTRRKPDMKRITVQAPGYVCTTSWSRVSTIDPCSGPVQKGRLVTPPPSSSVGLHRLAMEAFWLD